MFGRIALVTDPLKRYQLIFLIVLSVVCLVSGAGSSVQAKTLTGTCDSVKTINHFTLYFDSVNYDFDVGTSSWYYTLIWDGAPPQLSNLVVELCDSITTANLISASPNNATIGRDGRTGLYGIKWENPPSPANTPVSFSFTIDWLLAVEESEFAPSAGVNNNIATICGPSMACETIEPCDFNTPPVATCPGDDSLFVCDLDPLCIAGFSVSDIDGNLESVIVSTGTLDGDSVCFTPVAGVNTITLIATDSCGAADTCETSIYVTVNSPPVCDAFPNDTTVFQCQPEEICLPVGASDVDGNFSHCTLVSGDGSIVNGEWCFTPTAAGQYSAVIRCLDSCDAYCENTVTVTVEQNVPPLLTCPDVINTFLCEPDTICYPVTVVDPDDGVVGVVSPVEGWFNEFDSTVCFYADTAGTYVFTLVVTDSCGAADTCTTTVYVGANSPPVADAGADQTLFQCDLQQICWAAGCSDPDANLDSCYLVSGAGTFDGSRICFTPSGSGTYEFVLKAVDACGEVDYDTVTINVTLNTPPVASCPAGGDTLFLCSLTTDICLTDFSCSDADGNLLTCAALPGTLDGDSVCFTPVAGWNTITLIATDSCGAADTCETSVYVIVNSPPEPTCPLPDTVFLCELETICVTGFGCDDPDNNFSHSTINGDPFAGGEYCFMPSAGMNTLVLECVDSCGAVAACTTSVYVATGSPPVISGLPDSSLYLCLPQEICLPFEVTDPDGDVISVTSSIGKIENGAVCFVPYDSGTYVVTVTAVDSCGLVTTRSAEVTILTDQGIVIECPADTEVFTCQTVDTFCFKVGGIPDYADVEVWGINTWYNPADSTICFWSACATINNITVHVTTPCNTYECRFTVTVRCNNDPIVLLPADFNLWLCEQSEVCIPVGIGDPDQNLDSIEVEGGELDSAASEICFVPGASGTYVVRVRAWDECGAMDQDSVYVTVSLNGPPYISYEPSDTVFLQCGPESVCVPVVVGDPDDNLAGVTVSLGNYDLLEHQLCILPDTSGAYCIEIIAVDSCNMADTAQVCFQVEVGSDVYIECPDLSEPIPIMLCESGQLCWPLPIVGQQFSTQLNYGSWANDTVCFLADTNGLYEIEVIAEASCGADTCALLFDVTIDDSVSVSCPGDTSVLLCGPDTVALPFQVSFNVTSVTATAPAYIVDTTVYVPMLSQGAIPVKLTAKSPCDTASCTFQVTALFNVPPVVDAGPDTTIHVCELDTVCVPFQVTDANDNIESVVADTASVPGRVSTLDSSYCFLPPEFGSYNVIVIATDSCGLTDSDTVLLTVLPVDSVVITCPPGLITDSICGPDTVCTDLVITPSTATVSVLPEGAYDPVSQELCVYFAEGGTHQVTVIAADSCSADTCQLSFEIVLLEPPELSCPPGPIDTLFCLDPPDTICFPFDTAGTVSEVLVDPPAWISDGQICLEIFEEGTYPVPVHATGPCGDAYCTTTVIVTADPAPSLILPLAIVIERVPGDQTPVVVAGISAVDDAKAIDTLFKSCGPGTFELIRPDSGVLTFVPDTFGTYQFCFEASDGCQSVTDTFTVEIVPSTEPCFFVSIDVTDCVPVGLRQRVPIRIESHTRIGGFDLLISYDVSGLLFLSASIEGTAIDGWEYFQYRVGGSCGELCPDLLQFIGIADQNDGLGLHPPDSTLEPTGILINVDFQVSNDQNLGGLLLPVSFKWLSCGDNGISDPTGDNFYVDRRIFNNAGDLIWDEDDDNQYPESSRFPNTGTPDSCVVGGGPGKPAPIRCIDFVNGGVCIIHPESLDFRADINLNGVPYEIADAIVFINYFIYGFSAFRINFDGQVAATDVNADGQTLTVGDLVYLIRVITGDADPIPKLSPYPEELIVLSEPHDEGTVVTTDAVGDIGAALFVYRLSGDLEVDELSLAADAEDMDLSYTADAGELRVLVYDIGTGRVGPGHNRLVTITGVADTSLTLTYAEIVDYQGRPYVIARSAWELPRGFSLEQNYPNPFNPSTVIDFSLPLATDWRLQIYDITGRLVKEFTGHSEPGTVTVKWDGRSSSGQPVSTGVYLYRLDAGDFSATKKMMLLK